MTLPQRGRSICPMGIDRLALALVLPLSYVLVLDSLCRTDRYGDTRRPLLRMEEGTSY